MIKDRAKIKAALSVIALSMYFGFDAEYIDKQLKAGTVSVDKKEHRSMPVKVFGNVKGVSIDKARTILDDYMSDKAKSKITDDSFITIVESSKMEQYTTEKLKLNMLEHNGQKISDSEGIQIYCPEELIEDFLPQVLMKVNEMV